MHGRTMARDGYQNILSSGETQTQIQSSSRFTEDGGLACHLAVTSIDSIKGRQLRCRLHSNTPPFFIVWLKKR
ncbi:hypothetical protein Bpfe_022339 [Biomphalaria pfeifferi]|uniref:Uncharacterized protein n=1 Tax=Biomphalaria pfeifferi TaxID=112525 RepID=A0AAD8B569_BIOPF|nr:hypothetical protein Bpfe_022339 [Biomphalaria pfeifferi]